MFCSELDTDEHLFHCWGYGDLHESVEIDYNVFFTLDVGMDELYEYANILIKIYARLELLQK